MSATFSLKRNRVRASSLDLLSTKSKCSSHDAIRQKSEVKRISSHVTFKNFLEKSEDGLYISCPRSCLSSMNEYEALIDDVSILSTTMAVSLMMQKKGVRENQMQIFMFLKLSRTK